MSYQLVSCISPEDLERRIDEVAGRINADYDGKSVLIIGILNGAFIFAADLVRRLSVPVEIDFVRLSSYGSRAETSGVVQVTKAVELPIEGRHVLVVEDIVDTGTTLAWYLERLREYNPESVKVCALIDKLERREVEIPLDYACFRLDHGFLVGYGLDYSEKHRNLPGIYEVQFDV